MSRATAALSEQQLDVRIMLISSSSGSTSRGHLKPSGGGGSGGSSCSVSSGLQVKGRLVCWRQQVGERHAANSGAESASLRVAAAYQQ